MQPGNLYERAAFCVGFMCLLLGACSGPVPSEPSPVSSNRAADHSSVTQPTININTATAEELARLPGIGETLAARIVEHRKQHGPFRRPQDVIIVDGFSERKYRAIAGLVSVE
ncbi:MAG TPA: helix-hairpin-helix domain-containing protein [Blastocatellia bacterium]|nr:helix-hairpin-helix domain-containing protein [Blastocatellia bacterium]